MQRGDIYWANLKPRSGSEQKGRRPILIISYDRFNQNPKWRSLIVIPLSTSQKQMQRGPTVVLLSEKNSSLDRPSVALCHQVTTLDRTKLSKKIGELNPDLLVKVEEALKIALGMFEPTFIQ